MLRCHFKNRLQILELFAVRLKIHSCMQILYSQNWIVALIRTLAVIYLLQKLLEDHKLEPISIAKPDDWVEFDEYERIQLPTVNFTISFQGCSHHVCILMPIAHHHNILLFE
jgi:hypothetical protein